MSSDTKRDTSLLGGHSPVNMNFNGMDEALLIGEEAVRIQHTRIGGVITSSIEREIVDAFRLFDANNDGEINFYECQAAFRALRLNSDIASMRELFASAGKTIEDCLRLEDFRNLTVSQIPGRYTNEEVNRIFDLLQDGNGMITLSSLSAAAERIGASFRREELEIMVSEACKNGVGITLEEFRPLLWRSWSGGDGDGLSDDST
ncbi:bifunctional EF-hand domain/EF-hand domain pair [Babesia duncani]|uniref:Bifunctional EF-hand domain/EF-hand domain pair n=1 Tax=Babesia duncani TaxID=323732 RepID=A0AAD9UP13_9APIC|nr:bifunctional EF-hand domain/EF-hand domain pair [Babesia duncani]